MKDEMRDPKTGTGNPKAEIRRPKEGRNPKDEIRRTEPGVYSSGRLLAITSDLENWEGEAKESFTALHEEPPGNSPEPQALMERTAVFGEAIIRFAKKIPQNPVNNRLIEQVVGAGTSIGANYCEADDAVSGKEFKQRIGICRKESKETMFFLRIIAAAEETLRSEARLLWREAKELNLIFGAIWRK